MVDGVTKSFGQTAVLRGVDLTVDEHEVVVLIGASGSGKSTLLRCIDLLEEIDDGDIVLDGETITDARVDADAVRRKIGMVFQQFNLFPHLSVLDNIVLAPIHVHNVGRAEAIDHARRLLHQFGLSEHEHRYPDQLSGGQQQRVAILRALATRPRLLLLDEVTSALDPELVGEVQDLVCKLSVDGITMVLATHEMSFARQVASRICFLHHGVILESGAPGQLLDAPRQAETQRFLQRLSRLGGV